jgi:hypothetical protein
VRKRPQKKVLFDACFRARKRKAGGSRLTYGLRWSLSDDVRLGGIFVTEVAQRRGSHHGGDVEAGLIAARARNRVCGRNFSAA